MDRINGLNTVDLGGGRRGFRKKNKLAGIAGTELTEIWCNAVQEEIIKIIEAAGLVPSSAASDQLYQAILSMISANGTRFVYAATSGSANAYTITPNPGYNSLASLVGLPLLLRIHVTNTGASTLTCNSLAATALTRLDGSPLQSGDLVANRHYFAAYDGSAFRILTGILLDGILRPSHMPPSVPGPWVFYSPNNGSTGAVQIRDAASNPNAAILQFTNNEGTSQYSFLKGLPNGNLAIQAGLVFGDSTVQSSAHSYAGVIFATGNLTIDKTYAGQMIVATSPAIFTFNTAGMRAGQRFHVSGNGVSATLVRSDGGAFVSYGSLTSSSVIISGDQGCSIFWDGSALILENNNIGSGGLGYFQTWQNVTSSRALGTTFNNTTGRPIKLSVYVGFTNGNQACEIKANINGGGAFVFASGSNSMGGFNGAGTIVIPPKSTYAITAAPTGGLVSWFELKT